MHLQRNYEINTTRSNLLPTEEESLIKHVLGLPEEIRSYNLAHAIVAVSRLAADTSVTYSPEDFILVRNLGYEWRSNTALRDSLTPATRVFFDAYARLQELSSQMQMRFGTLETEIRKRELSEEYLRRETVQRLFGGRSQR